MRPHPELSREAYLDKDVHHAEVAAAVAAEAAATFRYYKGRRLTKEERTALDEAILAMSADLIRLGVYPFVVPFVPVGGTPLAHHPSPSAAAMRGLLAPLGKMLVEGGLKSADIKAGCGKCGACSSLASFETESPTVPAHAL